VDVMIASTGKTPERTGVRMQSTTNIDIVAAVNEIIAQYPETIAVFNRFGIDSCCGGGVPLADAARRDGADFDALLAALQEAIERR
jgi:iron-sulfur cluster repair protein YtfE (RIC family)